MADDGDEAATQLLIFEHLRGWYAVGTLGLGQRTGLLDALLEGPGTAEEIAQRAGVDPRNTREWLGAVTSAGHADHRDGVYVATDELAAAAAPDFPLDLRALLQLSTVAPRTTEHVVEAIRTGSGVDPSAYAELSAIAGTINTPTYAAALVDDWLAGVPGLTAELERGARVAELAPGSGDAAVLVGRAFPASTVVGWDLVPTRRDDLPDNVRLEVGDARSLPDEGPFDLVYAIDAFHHFGQPQPVLEQVLRVLAPGGRLLLVEGGLTGDLDTDRHDPFALVAYAAGLHYCLQENLAAGGSGRTGGDGHAWILDALAEAGFVEPDVHRSGTGDVVISARRPAPV